MPKRQARNTLQGAIFRKNYFVKNLTLFFFLIFAAALYAQCPEMPLNELQYLQKLDAGAKAAKIHALGFDPQNEFVRNGATFRGYNKCWQTTVGDHAVFDQKIIWNVTQNVIMFLTLNPAHYQHLRHTVAERHPETAGQTVVVGKMFRYEFSIQRLEGLDYYALAISAR